MLTATVRRDGSSKFGTNNKWGTFPSVSVGWNITQESFMEKVNWLNDLKLSVGYGITGNQTGLDPYKTLELYGTDGVYYDTGSWLPSYKISQNANPDLKWEQTAMLNIGLDFSVLDSRLGGRIEWYNKKTSDMLYTYPVPTPPYLYNKIMANVGDMRNTGIELSLNADAIRTKDFDWNISLNLAHNENEVTRLSNDVFTMDKILLGDVFIRGGSSSGTHVLEEGRPIGQFYGLVCNGIDENGRYILVDKDGDGEISDPADYDYIGSAQPKLTYGITNSFRYKNFDLSFFLRGTIGNDILNATRMAYAQSGFLPGTNALDDPLTYTLSETPRFSNYYLEKGSFMRLDNLTLGYKMLNIGLDFSVLDSRLGGRIEWYNKKTSDMLYTYPVPTPPYLYNKIMANVGDMRNTGIELSLNADAIRTKDFDWNISLNLAHNENEVTRLSNDVFTMDKILLGDVFIRGGSSSGTHVLEEGRPIGQFYGLVCNGIDENGRYILVDKDGDGEISDPADYDYIGSAQPKLTYGITNSFRYKNFDLSFFLRGTIGNDILNATRMAYAQSGFLPGTNALDDPLTYTLSETPRFSNYYLEKGSFMRLDNLTLGYKIKALNGIRVYFTAQNLFVITKYKGLDPEVPMDSGDGLTPGVEPREFYPKARTFSVGLNLNF